MAKIERAIVEMDDDSYHLAQRGADGRWLVSDGRGGYGYGPTPVAAADRAIGAGARGYAHRVLAEDALRDALDADEIR